MLLKQAEVKLIELMQKHGKARHLKMDAKSEYKKNKASMNEAEKIEKRKNLEALEKALHDAAKELHKWTLYVHSLRKEESRKQAQAAQGNAFVTKVSFSKLTKKTRGQAIAKAMVSFSNGITRHLIMTSTGHWVGEMPMKAQSTELYVRKVSANKQYVGEHEVLAAFGITDKKRGKAFSNEIQFDYTEYLLGDVASELRVRSSNAGYSSQEVKAA